MSGPKNHQHLHFIGICGVAMSALALAFRRQGHTVTGSDVGFYPPVSTHLKESGIDFYPGWHPERMGRPDLVIVGNVASSHNPEWLFVAANNIPYKSYPEVIRDFFIKKNSIVCAGTYGKSTSATLMTWILQQAGLNPSYMFGAISLNNIPAADITDSAWSVMEGDEYKASRSDNGPKFAYYSPTHLLLTSVVWDHADVYPTEASYRAAFKTLVGSVHHEGGKIISEKAMPIVLGQAKGCITYGQAASNDYTYTDVALSTGGVRFTIRHGRDNYPAFVPCLGEYMADNATGCFALASAIGIKPENILSAMQSFRGMKRRLEKRYEGNGITVFDDIAHSPSKAQAVLASLQKIYSGKIYAIFEPNTGNRLPESAPWYADAFRGADTVIIPHLTKIKKKADNTPAPLEGSDLAGIIGASHHNVHYIQEDAALINFIATSLKPGDVVAFLGSHGFRGMIEGLIEKLRT